MIIKGGVRKLCIASGRLVHPKCGTWRISASRFAKWLCAGLPLTWIRLRNGLSLQVDPCDDDGRMLYLFGTIDPRIVGTCQALLRPGDVLLDIGANCGALALSCQHSVLPHGRIVCFEPQSNLCRRIEECCERHHLAHIQVCETALADSDGITTLNIPRGHSGAATIAHKTSADSDCMTVRVSNTGRLIREIVEDRPFGAKVDVEGSELLVLPHLLRRTRARFVVFEVVYIPDKGELFRLLGEWKWSLFRFEKSIWRIRVVAASKPSDLSKCRDAVAVRLQPNCRPERVNNLRDLARNVVGDERDISFHSDSFPGPPPCETSKKSSLKRFTGS
jgi:FkbM family methyltransferase